MKKEKITFVIPCYNTTKVIYSVLNEISNEMKRIKKYSYEIILVNDCSKNDDTSKILIDVVNSRKKDNVILIDLAKNTGQPNAILTGLRYGTGDIFMTTDDDGQMPMNCIYDFLLELNKNNDVVFARYIERPQKSLIRKAGSRINKKMAEILIERPNNIEVSTIFMAKRFVVEEMIKYDQPFAYISGLILRITHNIGNVSIKQRERKVGESGYSIKKLIGLWTNGATSFSIKPLRIVSSFGFILAIVGFFIAMITIFRKLFIVDYEAGWSSIFSIIILSSGINYIALGIIGEYLGRSYLAINKTPQSVVRKIYRNN